MCITHLCKIIWTLVLISSFRPFLSFQGFIWLCFLQWVLKILHFYIQMHFQSEECIPASYKNTTNHVDGILLEYEELDFAHNKNSFLQKCEDRSSSAGATLYQSNSIHSQQHLLNAIKCDILLLMSRFDYIKPKKRPNFIFNCNSQKTEAIVF